MARSHSFAVIGGDGIGPEVTRAALRVLDAAERRFSFSTSRMEYPWSSARYVESGAHVTRADVDGLRKHEAILFGAIGDPRAPRGVVEREIIFGLRQGLDLFVNLRPVTLYDECLTPLKDTRAEDVDMVVVRENTEDVYTQPGAITGTGKDEVALAPMRFTRPGIERVVRYAFELARTRPKRHLTLVDKSNAIPVQELWRTIFEEIAAGYADVTRDAMYVDAASMWMVQKPEQFDVIVTTNLFGDILTDLGAALAGGLGIAASGNIHPGKTAMFALDSSIVATAMPRIISELAGLEYYAWVTTAYLVTSTTVIPIAGKLGDLFGRKRFLQGGTVGFLLTSALCGFAQTMPQLVAARALQGLFGGMLTASAIASMGDLFMPVTRAKIQGLFASVFAVANISGPIVGGLLTDTLGWRYIFYVNIPVGNVCG